jgi:hypothetical protein
MKLKDQPINPVYNQANVAVVGKEGLTKREYFTGLAMQSIISREIFSSGNIEDVNKLAIRYADELLKQLEK